MFHIFDKEIKQQEAPKIIEETMEPIKPKVEIPEDGYKWVHGYKALNHDMKSFHGNMQYEFGVVHSLRENEMLIPCRTGFHFCVTLQNVTKLFEPIYGRRYFKVRALAPVRYKLGKDDNITFNIKTLGQLEQELNNQRYSFAPMPPSFMMQNDKFIARQIEILEEVPFEEYKEYIKRSYLQEESIYKSILNETELSVFLNEKWIEICKKNGFSETFAKIYFKKYISANSFESVAENLEMFSDENLSHDTKMFLFLEEEAKRKLNLTS